MYSIDVVIEKKQKWTFKNLLLKRKVSYIEWFVEFNSESSIISFEIESEEHLYEVCDFLQDKSPCSRIVFPDGNSVKPSKKNVKEIYSELMSKLNNKEK